MRMIRKWKARKQEKVFAEMESRTVGAAMRRFGEAVGDVQRDIVAAAVESGGALQREMSKVYGLDPVTGALSWSPQVFEFWVICEHLSRSEVFSYGPFEHKAGRDLLWSAAVDLCRKIAHLRHPREDPWSWAWIVEWEDSNGRMRFAVYVSRDSDGFPVDAWADRVVPSFADSAADEVMRRGGQLLPQGEFVAPRGGS